MEYCSRCYEGIEVGWDDLDNGSLKCPHCGVELEVDYEESYDEESGDECGFFTLRVKGE